ncbi:MAG: LacI family transcriptional regulator [Oscillospiraceae bacterium]|jgi:alanine racemase/LacI family transcriptional regulator|nr:LacI family transcriptional regulator [Oscillospiraceae bacterium]
MTTIKDVARLAGVSPSTVSKYINGGSVRKENIASIRSAIARLDYRVNPIARSLKTRRSHSVGILLPSLAAPFFSSVFMASDRVLRERGYHSMISCYYADHGLERDYLSYLMNAGADGLIYVPENLTAEEFQELTAHRDIPVVQVDRMIPGVDSDTVLSENKKSACLAVSRLTAKGHRRIALVGGPSSVQTAKERLAGYLQALELNGILYDGTLVFSGELSFAFGYQSFGELMDSAVPPTAIFSTNHDITMGVITAARERGLRIPEEVDVFGFDCVDVCAVMSPPLPVVYQPEEEMGRLAAAYLMERLDGYSGEPRRTRLPCKLVP